MKKYFTPTNVTITCLIFAFFSPMVFTLHGCEDFNFKEKGPIGDTIGGLTAPFIGILNALLLYMTLSRQDEESKRQQVERREDEARRDVETRQQQEQFQESLSRRDEENFRRDYQKVKDLIDLKIDGLNFSYKIHEKYKKADHKIDDYPEGSYTGSKALYLGAGMFMSEKSLLSVFHVSALEWTVFITTISDIIIEAIDVLDRNYRSSLSQDSKDAIYLMITNRISLIISFYVQMKTYISKYPNDPALVTFGVSNYINFFGILDRLDELDPSSNSSKDKI